MHEKSFIRMYRKVNKGIKMIKKIFFLSLVITAMPSYGMEFVKKMLHKSMYFRIVTSGIVGEAITDASLCQDDRKAKEEQLTEFEKFAKKFAPPKEVQETIEANKKNMPRFGGRLPGSNPPLYVKGDDIARIQNADRMRTCIEANKLTTVTVPKKYLYKVGDEWRVFAEYIRPIDEGKSSLSFQEVQDLTTVAEQTGYRDWANNILRDKNIDKLTIIDTEDDSFAIGRYCIDEIPVDCKAQYVFGLMFFIDRMDEKTKEWCNARLNEHLNNKDGISEEHKPLYDSTQFDDPTIDFKKAEREFRMMQRRKNLLNIFEKSCITDENDKNRCKKLVHTIEELCHRLKTEHGATSQAIEDSKLKQAFDYWKSVD